MIVSIEGNIGSGKSTLLSLLEKIENFHIVPEDVESWKNEGWLELFYSDIKRYAGTFQLRTQISHMHNKNKFVQDKINIVERSPLSNKYIFGKMLMEDGLLHPKEYEIIGKVNELMGWNPDKIVILMCDPQVCYERIQKRNREGENIPSLGYLESLHKKHLELQNHFTDNVYVIDTTYLSPEKIAIKFLNLILDIKLDRYKDDIMIY